MVISICDNALVLTAIWKTPSLRSPSTIFLSSLAVSDLLVGFIVQPVFIATFHKFELGSSLFLTSNVMTLFLCSVSISTMTAISVDRFLALFYHMRYPNFMSIKSAIYTSTALWFLGVVFSCVRLISSKAFILIGVAVIAVCLLISSYSYFRVYLIVRRHQLQIYIQQQAVENLNAEDHLNVLRSKKSAITTFIYYICMVICYSPSLILMSIISSSPNRLVSLIVWWTLATTATYMNSAINPFLYCWRMSMLRAEVLKILRKTFFKRRTESWSMLDFETEKTTGEDTQWKEIGDTSHVTKVGLITDRLVHDGFISFCFVFHLMEREQ